MQFDSGTTPNAIIKLDALVNSQVYGFKEVYR